MLPMIPAPAPVVIGTLPSSLPAISMISFDLREPRSKIKVPRLQPYVITNLHCGSFEKVQRRSDRHAAQYLRGGDHCIRRLEWRIRSSSVLIDPKPWMRLSEDRRKVAAAKFGAMRPYSYPRTARPVISYLRGWSRGHTCACC